MAERRAILPWRNKLRRDHIEQLQDTEVAAHVKAYENDRAGALKTSRFLKNVGFGIFLLAGAAVIAGPAIVPALPAALVLAGKTAIITGSKVWFPALALSAFGLAKEMVNKQMQA